MHLLQATHVVLSLAIASYLTGAFAHDEEPANRKEGFNKHGFPDRTKSTTTAKVGRTDSSPPTENYGNDGNDGPPNPPDKKSFIVMMRRDTTASFAASNNGKKESEAGTKVDFSDPNLKEYAKSLKNDQMGLAEKIGAANDVTNNFVYAANGFSTYLDESQLEELQRMDEVAAVVEDAQLRPTTDSTQEFLGITGNTDDGASCRRIPFDGKGVVVGIIDTGIWPEHPSFADDGTLPQAPTLPFFNADGDFINPCDFGNTDHNQNDANFACNNKLIGGRTFLKSFEQYFGIESDQFKSCRDDDGHGTHTASIAAGNANVNVDYDGYPNTTVSGVAPMAHVMAYKVCGQYLGYGGQVGGACFTSDSAAAIDQAVSDGVDVINFSIGGDPGTITLSEMMFLEATRAGVFVATSAGNSGRDGSHTVGSPASVPWITSVGASTEPRTFEAMVFLQGRPGWQAVGVSAFDHLSPMTMSTRKRFLREPSNARLLKGRTRKTRSSGHQSHQDRSPRNHQHSGNSGSLRGPKEHPPTRNQFLSPQNESIESECGASSVSDDDSSEQNPDTYVTATLVDGEEAGDALCRWGSLDGSIVEGAIVLCLRGQTDRVEKSAEVQRAGGVGMIFYNAPWGSSSLHADLHSVQTVHLTHALGNEIKGYIANTTDPVASLSVDTIGTSKAPEMADFSSRGPSFYEHQIKPDITAPGVNILAGTTPMQWLGEHENVLYQVLSGTSMSSPHIAGVFALIKEAHPDWSASKARSAIMTTAYQEVYLNADGEAPADPMDMGSGHLDNNNRWLDPGLAYPTTYLDYNAFLCGRYSWLYFEGCEDFFASMGLPLEPWNLNYPSIVATDFVGIRTVLRTVESVDTADPDDVIEYTAHVDAPPGYDVVVSPPVLALRGGESSEFSVTVTAANPAFDGDYAFGSLTWVDGQSGRNYSVHSPIAANATAIDGIPSHLPYHGDGGCVDYEVTFGFDGPFTVTPFLEAAQVFGNSIGQGYYVPHPIVVQGGNRHLRIVMRTDEYQNGYEDLDLKLFDPSGDVVAVSWAAWTNELISVDDPVDGIWILAVEGYSTPGGAEVPYEVYTWTIPAVPGAETHLSVSEAPSEATVGATETIELCYDDDLSNGVWYWGYVLHEADAVNATLPTATVEVDKRFA